MAKDKEQQQKESFVDGTAREIADHRTQEHFVILIQKVDQNSRNSIDPVPVGVNGVLYAIRRGKPALVPACVKEVLENAVEKAYEAEDNDASKKEERDVISYPFQVLEGPIPPDVARKRIADAKREKAAA